MSLGFSCLHFHNAKLSNRVHFSKYFRKIFFEAYALFLLLFHIFEKLFDGFLFNHVHFSSTLSYIDFFEKK